MFLRDRCMHLPDFHISSQASVNSHVTRSNLAARWNLSAILGCVQKKASVKTTFPGYFSFITQVLLQSVCLREKYHSYFVKHFFKNFPFEAPEVDRDAKDSKRKKSTKIKVEIAKVGIKHFTVCPASIYHRFFFFSTVVFS